MLKKSLAKKMTLVYFIILLLPVLIISYFSYYFYRNSLEQNISHLTEQTLNQAGLNLKAYLDEASKLTLLPYSSTEMTDFLSGNNTTDVPKYWPNKQQDIINSISYSSMLTTESIVGIFLYSRDGRVFYHTKSSVKHINSDYEAASWYQTLKQLKGSHITLGTHKESQLVKEPYVISMIRAIYEYEDTDTPIGVIMVDLDVSIFSSILQRVDLGKGSRLLITDEQGRIIHDTQGLDTLNKNFDALSLNKPDFYVYTKNISSNGWSLIGVVPSETVTSPIRVVSYWILILLVLCLVSGLILLLGISFRITQPIRQLRWLMHQMENENFDARYSGSQQDEIGELGRGFNLMSTKIKTLIDDVYRAEISSKDAQLAALKSEINPHFLFNTLESIHMRAELGDTTAISKMTLSLSKLLRSSIDNDQTLITLSDELGTVENYLNIVNLHYTDRLRVHIDIPDNLYKLKILRFIIQPILENAVKHGVEKQRILTNIWIKAEKDENNLFIEIENDGPSISPERLERLQFSLDQENGPWYGGIGMMNVHKRLRLFYGKNYGISIIHREPRGVIIRLQLPIEEERA